MSPPIPDRARVMATLNRQFRDHGYEGATLRRICAATGLPRGSLYYYFPNGKADMLLAVLEDTEEQFERAVLRPMREAGPPKARARRRAMDAVVRIQGALIVCRGLGEQAAFRDVLSWLHSNAFLRDD